MFSPPISATRHLLPLEDRESVSRQVRFESFAAKTELPIAALAFLIAPVLVIEGHAKTELVRDLARAANWIIWLVFCAEYVIKVRLAPDRKKYICTAWWDLVIVILATPVPLSGVFSGAPSRIVGFVRFLRGASIAALGLRMRSHILRPNRLHYAAITTGAVITLGALGIFAVEHGINPRIQTFGDAIWWSIVTATTVGYGDVSPITPEGRLIAIGLMLLGIAFIGVFTATVSSFFFDQGRVSQVEERLARIEAKLDALAAMRMPL
jgi:voltage-gated potassium channel